MPSDKKAKDDVPESMPEQKLPQPSYPVLEGFIEKASLDDISSLFTDLKEALTPLKGARAEQGKKVGKAIERTEELLAYLLEVREKIEAERKNPGGKPK